MDYGHGRHPAHGAGPVTVIDIHAHAMPLPLLEWLADRGLADLTRLSERVVVIDPIISGVVKGAPLPLAPSMIEPRIRIEELNDTQVDLEAVSLPPFLIASNSTDHALVNEVIARGNDALADYCAVAPDRLVGLGAVPVGTAGAAAEARRCLDDLGMVGIAIGSRGGGVDLDAAINDDLWALVSQRDVFVFLHPSAVPDPARMANFWFPQLVGYPMETAIAAARLAFSGVLERTPMRICLAHGGGCLPALRGRLDMGWARKDVAHTTVAPPSDIFARLYYDTAVFDPVALRRLVEDVGADHVLMGTDHPFDLAERDPVGFVSSVGLGVDEQRDVLGRNAARLLGLPH